MRNGIYFKLQAKLLLTQPMSLLLMLIFCATFASVNYALNHGNAGAKRVPMALVDLDSSGFTRAIREKLLANEMISLDFSEEESQLHVFQQALERNKLEAVFVFQMGLADKLLTGNHKGVIDVYYGTSPVAAKLLTEAVSASILEENIKYEGFALIKEAYAEKNIEVTESLQIDIQQYTEEMFKTNLDFPIESKVIGAQTEGKPLSFRALMYHCILILLLFFYFTLNSVRFLAEKESGVFLRLLVNRRSPYAYVFYSNCVSLLCWGLPVCMMSILIHVQLTTLAAIGILLLWFLSWLSWMILFFSRRVFLLAASIIVLLLAFTGGLFAFYADNQSMWRFLLAINPISNYLRLTNHSSWAVYLFATLISLAVALMMGNSYGKKCAGQLHDR